MNGAGPSNLRIPAQSTPGEEKPEADSSMLGVPYIQRTEPSDIEALLGESESMFGF